MIYIFCFLCLTSGIATVLSGVNCFTVSGRNKLIDSKKNNLNALLDWNNPTWSMLGITSIAWGILSITFAVKLVMGA